MIRKIKYILTLTLLVCHSYGQGGFRRNIVLPNSKAHFSLGVEETTPNNYIHVGLVVDTLNGYQTNRLCIMGLNQNGQVQWVKKYGNHKFVYLNYSARSKWIKKIDNSIYLATAVTDSNNITFGVLIKISFNGDTVWQKKYYAPSFNVTPYDVCKTKDNGFLITGAVYDNVDQKLLLIKTNSLGTELWRKFINKPTNNGPNYQVGLSIIEDTISKKILIGGLQYIGSPTWWTSYSNLVLTDSLGNFLLRKNYPNGVAGAIDCLKQLKDGSIIASGSMSNLETFNFYELGYGYIIKLQFDDNLTIINQKQNIDEKSVYNAYNNIIELENGNLVFAGYQDTSYHKGRPFNLLGKILWTDKNGNQIKKLYYSYKDPLNNNSYICGLTSFNRTTDNGFIAAYYYNSPTFPGKFMVVKYDSTGCDSSAFYCTTVGIKENNYQAADVSIYPQPANNVLNLSSVLFANKKAQIQISNNLGQLLIKQHLQFNNGIAQLPLANLPKGIYFIKLTDEDLKTFTQKLIIE
jgi:hypothetical protein